MSSRRKRQKFTLVEIDTFDARRGYKRCSITGAGYTPPVNPMSPFRLIPVAADFWRNKTGGLVVRFSSNQPNAFHFEALLVSGKPVPEERIAEFADFVSTAVLCDWVEPTILQTRMPVYRLDARSSLNGDCAFRFFRERRRNSVDIGGRRFLISGTVCHAAARESSSHRL